MLCKYLFTFTFSYFQSKSKFFLYCQLQLSEIHRFYKEFDKFNLYLTETLTVKINVRLKIEEEKKNFLPEKFADESNCKRKFPLRLE